MKLLKLTIPYFAIESNMHYVNISCLTCMQFIPPSPVLDFPPTLFMARARVVCASKDMLPKLMAPETKDYSSYQGI
jgi:hypothetical protein